MGSSSSARSQVGACSPTAASTIAIAVFAAKLGHLQGTDTEPLRIGSHEYELLAEPCVQVRIELSSTPFDYSDVVMLPPQMSFFEIASADLSDTPLLRHAVRTGKPVVLSTGASTMEDLDWSAPALRTAGAKDVALLHWIVNCPTAIENSNLRMLNELRRTSAERILGYCDHTVPSPPVEHARGGVVERGHHSREALHPRQVAFGQR